VLAAERRSEEKVKREAGSKAGRSGQVVWGRLLKSYWAFGAAPYTAIGRRAHIICSLVRSSLYSDRELTNASGRSHISQTQSAAWLLNAGRRQDLDGNILVRNRQKAVQNGFTYLTKVLVLGRAGSIYPGVAVTALLRVPFVLP
jgi:hypothetical protein